MTQISSTSKQDSTGQLTAAQGFLAAIKGGLGFDQGGVFSDFLSQFKMDEATTPLPKEEEKKVSANDDSSPRDDARAMEDLLASLRDEKETLKALRKGKESHTTDDEDNKVDATPASDPALDVAQGSKKTDLPADAPKTATASAPVTQATSPNVEESTVVLMVEPKTVDARVKVCEAKSTQEDVVEEAPVTKEETKIDPATMEQALMFFRPELSRAKEEKTLQGFDAKTTEGNEVAAGDAVGSLGSAEPAKAALEAGKEPLKAKQAQAADSLQMEAVAPEVPVNAAGQASPEAPRTHASEVLKTSSKTPEMTQAVQNLTQVFQSAQASAMQAPALTSASSQVKAQDVSSIGSTQGVSKAGGATTPFMLEGTRTTSSYDAASQLSASKTSQAQGSSQLSVIEQVKLHLKKQAKDGTEEMTLQLRPSDMGRIEVKLKFDADKQVTGTVVADNPATLDLLLKDVGSLQRALQDAGLRADAGCLQFSLRDGGGQGQGSFADGRSSSGFNQPMASLAKADLADAISVETYYLAPGRVNLSV